MSSRSRPFDKSVDFEAFDMILIMDEENYKFLKSLDIKNVYGYELVYDSFCNLRKQSLFLILILLVQMDLRRF